ncbi:hypothetical protein SUGI_1089270 [Cryptomeria japonica]|nr:hypothetical protein SUGI_1089270 [Cryptomeria japonica]
MDGSRVQGHGRRDGVLWKTSAKSMDGVEILGRQDDITQCSNNQSMIQMDHTEFFSYPPESESNSEIYYLGFPDCWENCLKNPSCIASTLMNDGTGTCRMKTSNFTSAYQAVSIPSTSNVKNLTNAIVFVRQLCFWPPKLRFWISIFLRTSIFHHQFAARASCLRIAPLFVPPWPILYQLKILQI